MKILNQLRIFTLILLGLSLLSPTVFAKSAREIDASVDTALTRFEKEVPGAKQLLEQAKGVLVFPSVIKAGIGLGGEYGVGSLTRTGIPQKEYYNIIGASFGFQLGGQVRSVYLLFMNSRALEDFRVSDGWKAGVDGSVALITIGADGSIDTSKTNKPIVAFILGQKGLMYNLTLEGAKFNHIDPEE